MDSVPTMESDVAMRKKMTPTDRWARHNSGREGMTRSSAKPRERGVTFACSWATGALGLRALVGRGSDAGPLWRGKLKWAA